MRAAAHAASVVLGLRFVLDHLGKPDIASPSGQVNNVLTGLGVVHQPVNWLGTPVLAMLLTGVVVAWVLSGFTTVVYLTSLQNIPRELYEASAIDGASSRQQYRLQQRRLRLRLGHRHGPGLHHLDLPDDRRRRG